MSYICDHCNEAIDQEEDWVEADSLNKDIGAFNLSPQEDSPLHEIVDDFKIKTMATNHDLHWHVVCFIRLLSNELKSWLDKYGTEERG